MAVLCFTLCARSASAGSAPDLRPQSYGYFDFPTCVRYALSHSDLFLENRIDIQIASLDLKDAHAELLPTLQLITRYYISRAARTDEEGKIGRFSAQVMMLDWNPYAALFKIRAQGVLVDIAKTNHIRKIGEHTGNMAKLFYAISLLEKSIRTQNEMVAMKQKKVGYGKSREAQGSMDPLELRAWENSVKGDQIQQRTLKKDLDQKIGQLKMIMGYPPDHHLPLDTRDAVNQILAGFNGKAVTFAEVQADNPGLKILAKKEQLQSGLVSAAYVSLLPRPLLVFEDVQNQVDRSSGFNLALGMDYTLWDGFKRVREIKRQKMRMRKAAIERKEASEQLYGDFKTLRGNLDLAPEAEAQAHEQAKLAELSEERSFMAYKSGDLAYEHYMDARVRKIAAQLEAARSGQARVMSLIELATMAGGLDKYHAGIRY